MELYLFCFEFIFSTFKLAEFNFIFELLKLVGLDLVIECVFLDYLG